jgi:hypothetical protein
VPKIVFDLQLADLPIQKIDLRLAGHPLGRAAALENARGTVQKLLLPVVNLVRMNPKLTRQLGDRPVALDRCQGHLGLEPRVVLLGEWVSFCCGELGHYNSSNVWLLLGRL